MSWKILEYDPYLKPYENDINLRMENYLRKRSELAEDGGSLYEFAGAHKYFGFHRENGTWVYREWAPGADAMFLMGDMNGWDKSSLPMKNIGSGVFEIRLDDENALYSGCKVKAVIEKDGAKHERIPLYAEYVVQDPSNAVWCAEIYDESYEWKCTKFKVPEKLYIYECHIGMAQEKDDVGTYVEFTRNILPRIKADGYNAVQIMAVMEHPYYASFGYQVSSFFAPSSRFGTPNELKMLIDTAHKKGIAVLLDVVHSHAVKNIGEGLNMFDGTPTQFFRSGADGEHPAWGTKLFDYGKNEVIRFLLSNLRYWLEEFRFDGFRFDGVTSMIYHNHGLGEAFDNYGKYFSLNTDTEAVTYLQLANELVRTVKKDAVTIAEDMSGMPGMCLEIADGGIGFDYRLAMGAPDMWIKLASDKRDEEWNMHGIWHELANRRPMEKCIGYAESHDQALVGDKTLMFRLCGKEMYDKMSKNTDSIIIDRGIALCKLIRLVTLSLAGEGYLNFMGNEFGHPEWIDFPRAENGWSSFYCRRQWHLADDDGLKYGYLGEFDKKLIKFAKRRRLFDFKPESLYIDDTAQVMVYKRGKVIFAVNFNPVKSHESYFVPTPQLGKYLACFTTDEKKFGGWDRVPLSVYHAKKYPEAGKGIFIYLPSRTVVCLVK